jgi:hypothetical protein
MPGVFQPAFTQDSKHRLARSRWAAVPHINSFANGVPASAHLTDAGRDVAKLKENVGGVVEHSIERFRELAREGQI